MGLFDNLLDDNSINTMDNRDIALGALSSSKADISMLSKVIPEVTNPQLRQMLTSQLNNCINDHFKLSDMAMNKGWYPAYSSPEEQLKNDSDQINKFDI